MASNVPAGWDLFQIEEIASPEPYSLVGNTFGSRLKASEYVAEGIPVLRGANLAGPGRFNPDGAIFVTEAKADELRSQNAFPGDIIFTQQGSVGQVGIIPHDSAYPRWVVSQSQMKLRPDPQIADPLYVYYYFRQSAVIERLQSMAVVTGVPHINLGILRTFPIILPPVPEQQAIARILGTLDDKIELNRRENETLEAMAQALFKSWFVDFDPVRAKAAGCQPEGMDAATAALFPAAFEASELGDVPQGWQIGKLQDVADITMGQSPPGETYNETGEGTPFYQGTRDFGPRFPSRRVYCVAPSRFAESGDILFSVRAPVGNINVATERCAIGRGVAALRSPSVGNGFLFYWLRGNDREWAKFEASGTVFGSVSRSDIANVRLITPSNQLMIRFGQIVEAWDQQYSANERESQTLAKLRDTLLPKLLSGEVRVNI